MTDPQRNRAKEVAHEIARLTPIVATDPHPIIEDMIKPNKKKPMITAEERVAQVFEKLKAREASKGY